MAVLARVHMTSQQRLDLPQLLGIESYTAYDFRALMQAFVGSTRPYIARGFEVNGKTGLFLSVSVADCFVFNPLDESGSFYLGAIDASDMLIELPPSQPFVYLEARFLSQTSAAVSASYWDPLAVTGNIEGAEFTATQNSQNAIEIELSVNTVGFSIDAVPITVCSTSNSAVLTLSDARPLLFRLGSGGASPNPGYKFPWSGSRGEPLPVGGGTGNDVLSSFRSRDNTGVLNDKGIRTFKEMFDAICTRISEISGASIWYANNALQQYVGGLSLSGIFFDSVGHSLQPNRNFVYSWSGTNLSNTGTEAATWRANYCDIEWQLGNTFTSGTDRSYSDVQFDITIPDGSNAYLTLEREVVKNAGNSLDWKNPNLSTTYTDFVTNYEKVVCGVTGDFGGIAVGDYIRKESQGTSQYYRIVALATSTSLFSQTTGVVADSSVVAVKLSENIDLQSNEPLRYFRSRYSMSDVIVLAATDNATSVDDYWLARRRGDFIWLRDFGPLYKNKNWEHIDRAWSKIKVLKEYENLFLGGGGIVSWQVVPGDNTLTWTAPFQIEIAGRSSVYSIPANTAVLADGECLYVDIPEEDVSQNMTPIICALADVPLDPAATGHTGRSFVLFYRSGSAIIGMGEAPDLDSGESGNVGWDLPLNIRARLGILTEVSYQAYGSYTQIAEDDDYATAIGKLDLAAYLTQNRINQNLTLKLIKGGWWTWNASTGTLTNSASAYVQVPGLNETRNGIAAQSIVLPADGAVAYVDLNRTGTAPDDLTVVVTTASALNPDSPAGNDYFVIARRTGNNCLVDHTLFTNTESKLLDHDMSVVDNYDPSITATDAPKGTQLLDTTSSQLWLKQDSGTTTNWKPLDWSLLLNTFSGYATTTGIGLYFSGINQETVNISGTRTFYIQGRPFKVTTTDSITMSGAPGPRYFYYDVSGTLQQSLSIMSFVNNAYSAVAYWTGTSGHSLGWEFHGLRDIADHTWKHLTVGTRYLNGLQQTSSPLVVGAPTDDTNSYLWLTSGAILDEDIRISIVYDTTPTEKWQQDLGAGLTSIDAGVFPMLYVDSLGVARYVAPDANRFPFYHAGGNTKPHYDNSGVLTEASDGKFLVYWAFGTSTVVVDDVNFGKIGTSVYIRPHNIEFNSLIDAAAAHFNSLNWAGMSVQENKALYRYIIECDSAFTNATHRCKIVQVDDFRSASPVPVGASTASSHLLLSDLNGSTYGDGNHQNLIVSKLSGVLDPTLSDDILAYKELTLWLNQTTRDVWVCKNNALGAAVWKQLILDGGNASALSIGSTVTQNTTLIYNSLSRLTINAEGVDVDQTLRLNNNLASIVTVINAASASLDTYYAEVSAALASDCAVALPTASGANLGKEYRIKKLNSNVYKVTLTPNGADTIEGRASISFTAEGEVYHLKSFGTGWRIL